MFQFELKLQGLNHVKRLPYPLRRNVLLALSDGMMLAQRKAQTSYMTGPRPERLGVVTGRLRSSLYSFASENPGTQDWVGLLGTNVNYAAIHELGGITRPHPIVAKNRPYLVFWWDRIGKWMKIKSVHHPGSRIPARPYLDYGIRMTLPKIFNLVQLAINKAIEES
jgi:phage gpG-like protein